MINSHRRIYSSSLCFVSPETLELSPRRARSSREPDLSNSVYSVHTHHVLAFVLQFSPNKTHLNAGLFLRSGGIIVVIRHNCHLAIQSTIQSTIQNEARIQSERDVKTKGERGVEGRHHLPIALSLRSAPHSESWIESWIESRGDNYVG
eukprot:sb/3473630/